MNTAELDLRIEQEKDPSRRYWLKQARAHFRASHTHYEKGQAILLKMATYKKT